MSAIYFMLPFALLLGFGFMAAFIWMTVKGQYDDLETPAHRLLFKDEPCRPDLVDLVGSSNSSHKKGAKR